jgi:hypothetical protein
LYKEVRCFVGTTVDKIRTRACCFPRRRPCWEKLRIKTGSSGLIYKISNAKLRIIRVIYEVTLSVGIEISVITVPHPFGDHVVKRHLYSISSRMELLYAQVWQDRSSNFHRVRIRYQSCREVRFSTLLKCPGTLLSLK